MSTSFVVTLRNHPAHQCWVCTTLCLDGGVFVSCKTSVPARLMWDMPGYYVEGLPLTDFSTTVRAIDARLPSQVLEPVIAAMQNPEARSNVVKEMSYVIFGTNDKPWSEICDHFKQHCGPLGPILSNRDCVYLEYQHQDGHPKVTELQTLNILATYYDDWGNITDQFHRCCGR